MASKEELLAKLSECVVEMEDEEVVDVAKEYIEAGYPAFDGIMEGLVDGMNKASELYDAEEYFVRDVPLDQFIEKAKEVNADLICMSTLMTTTMGGMQTVIEKLKDQGIRDQFKVMVGGSPISKKFADDIGAEGYSVNAVEAVKVAKELTGIA